MSTETEKEFELLPVDDEFQNMFANVRRPLVEKEPFSEFLSDYGAGFDDSAPFRVPRKQAAQVVKEIRESFLAGRRSSLVVTEHNMYPFLNNQRDRVILAPVKRKIRKGDILFYLRENGSPTLSRVITKPEHKKYTVCGDAQCPADTKEEIVRSQVIGIVTDVIRHNECLSCSSFSWKVCSKLWMLLHFCRPQCLKIVAKFRRFTNRD